MDRMMGIQLAEMGKFQITSKTVRRDSPPGRLPEKNEGESYICMHAYVYVLCKYVYAYIVCIWIYAHMHIYIYINPKSKSFYAHQNLENLVSSSLFSSLWKGHQTLWWIPAYPLIIVWFSILVHLKFISNIQNNYIWQDPRRSFYIMRSEPSWVESAILE